MGKDKKKKEDEKKVEYVAMCCPSEEHEIDAKNVREKIILGLGGALEGRGNVVMTRLNDEDLENIDALVEVEAFKSRSEAAAFFIREGIQARKDLFQKVMPTVERIRKLKKQAKESLLKKKEEG